MKFGDYPKAPSLGGVAGLRAHLEGLGQPVPIDDVVEGGPQSPLARPIEAAGLTIGNRFAINHM